MVFDIPILPFFFVEYTLTGASMHVLYALADSCQVVKSKLNYCLY